MPLCWTTDNTRPAEAAGGKFARGGQTLFFTNVQTKFSVKDPSKDSSWMILFIHDESDVKISQLYGRCHQLSSAAYAGPQSQCQSVGHAGPCGGGLGPCHVSRHRVRTVLITMYMEEGAIRSRIGWYPGFNQQSCLFNNWLYWLYGFVVW